MVFLAAGLYYFCWGAFTVLEPQKRSDEMRRLILYDALEHHKSACSAARNSSRRLFASGRNRMRHEDLTAFFDSLPAEVRGLVQALRNVVRRIVPEAEETLLWGGLSYHRPKIGGRVKGAVCQIVAKGDRVRLDFIHGVRLADPSGLLQGDRLSKRFVPIESFEDAVRPELAALICEAAALDPTQWD
jgi:hypothetical protein